MIVRILVLPHILFCADQYTQAMSECPKQTEAEKDRFLERSYQEELQLNLDEVRVTFSFRQTGAKIIFRCALTVV